MAERTGIFDDVDYLVSDISNAYRNQMFPDVTFVLTDGVTKQTNRFMLACRSKYFATKLLGLEEDDGRVVMNCDSKIFQLLLDYIWEGKVDYSDLELKHLLELLENARMMCLERLVANIQEYLSYLLEEGMLMETKEYWTVLDFSSNHGFKEILTSVLKFIDENFNTICSYKHGFFKVPTEVVFTLLENKNRAVQEIDVFKAVTLWLENQPSPVEDSTRAAMLDLVNLAAVTPVDLLRVVRRSGLYTDMDICDAMEKQMNKKNDEGAHPRTLEEEGEEEEKDDEEIYPQKETFTGEDCRSLTQEYEDEEDVGAALHEDHEKASPRDDTQEDQDVKASPRHENSLIKWWKSRDTLLSPSKGM